VYIMIIYYGKISLTSGEEYLIGYDHDDPSTGNVHILKIKP